MNKPRVLVLTHSLSPVDGVGVYGVNTLRYLAPRCAGISVLLGRGHRGFAPDLPRDGVEILPILPTGPFPFLPLPKLLWLVLSSLPLLVRAARRAEIVHSFSDYPMGFVAALVGWLARRPVLVSGHGTYSVAPCSMPVHRRLIGWMYARADRVLMGAHFALARLREVAATRAAEVVPYGCVPADYDTFAAAGESAGVPGPFLLTVGEVKQRKGHHTSLPAFLRAWRERPELHYAIVGRFVEGDGYFEELRAQVAAAGAGAQVHFLGNVSQGRKVALMRAARAFVLTPTTSDEGGFEAFGLVYLEAGAAGRPVLGVRRSGAEDAIADGENGYLLDAGDVAGLARAMVRLAADPALADRLGAAGRARAETRTWEAAAARVAEIYAELLGARDGVGRRASGDRR